MYFIPWGSRGRWLVVDKWENSSATRKWLEISQAKILNLEGDCILEVAVWEP